MVPVAPTRSQTLLSKLQDTKDEDNRPPQASPTQYWFILIIHFIKCLSLHFRAYWSVHSYFYLFMHFTLFVYFSMHLLFLSIYIHIFITYLYLILSSSFNLWMLVMPQSCLLLWVLLCFHLYRTLLMPVCVFTVCLHCCESFLLCCTVVLCVSLDLLQLRLVLHFLNWPMGINEGKWIEQGS